MISKKELNSSSFFVGIILMLCGDSGFFLGFIRQNRLHRHHIHHLHDRHVAVVSFG